MLEIVRAQFPLGKGMNKKKSVKNVTIGGILQGKR
jgi:hypothetical protein